MEEIFSHFHEYYTYQQRISERNKAQRADLRLLQEKILPFLEAIVAELENNKQELSFDIKMQTAISAGLDTIDIDPELIDGIKEVAFDVALLNNKKESLHQALDNFTYHLYKFIEMKHEIIESLTE